LVDGVGADVGERGLITRRVGALCRTVLRSGCGLIPTAESLDLCSAAWIRQDAAFRPVRAFGGWPERRRTWSDGDKLAIVRETLAPGAVVQVVADRHGIGTGLLYTWRKQMLLAAMTGFAAVEITPEAAAVLQVTDGTAAPAAAQPETAPPAAAPAPSVAPGLIEVELPAGVRLRVGADVDGLALRRVLAALAAP